MFINMYYSKEQFSDIAHPHREYFDEISFNRKVKKIVRAELLEYEELYRRLFKEQLLWAIEMECIRVTNSEKPSFKQLWKFIDSTNHGKSTFANTTRKLINLLKMVAYLEDYLGKKTCLEFDRNAIKD